MALTFSAPMDVCPAVGGAPSAAFPPMRFTEVEVEGAKRWRCEWEGCGKDIGDSTSQQRQHHWRTHTGEKPYKCDYPGCNKRFIQHAQLATHNRRAHTDEKPFVCAFPGCNGAFAEKRVLQRHSLVHTGEKPYACDFVDCYKTFADMGDFVKHKRTHTGEKPYACGFSGCGKCFVQRAQLLVHERIHTGDKPYKCDFQGCSKAFAAAGTLAIHKRTHQGQLVAPCPGYAPGEPCPWNRTKSAFYDNLCMACFVARTEKTHPSDPRLAKANKFLRAKEHKVAEFLEQAFPQYRWTLNRMFAAGVLQRPDAKTVLGRERLLIVEIDEHSHRDRRCASEREREALFKQHAPRGATVFLVRINPDAYDDPATGERVRGCFVRCKQEGREVVPPERADEWARRLEALRKTIQEIIDHQHEDVASFFPGWLREEDDRYANVHPIELFYDAVREKYGVEGDRGVVEGMKRAKKAKKAQKRKVGEMDADSDTTDDD